MVCRGHNPAINECEKCTDSECDNKSGAEKSVSTHTACSHRCKFVVFHHRRRPHMRDGRENRCKDGFLFLRVTPVEMQSSTSGATPFRYPLSVKSGGNS